jgi:transcriptional regulator with XRE-family HTH domain
MLERGLRIPSIATVFQISKVLRKTPSQIIKLVEERYKSAY